VEPAYEFFDHTADIGISIRGATLPELIAPAGEGLYAVIGQIVGRGDAETITFDFTGDDPAVLLRDYLGELLILFERDARVVTKVDVSTFTDNHLTVTVYVGAVDDRRSVFHREVKAITYHELGIKTIAGGLEARVIVDI
jgi:SHS2 domain-containing protein